MGGGGTWIAVGRWQQPGGRCAMWTARHAAKHVSRSTRRRSSIGIFSEDVLTRWRRGFDAVVVAHAGSLPCCGGRWRPSSARKHVLLRETRWRIRCNEVAGVDEKRPQQNKRGHPIGQPGTFLRVDPVSSANGVRTARLGNVHTIHAGCPRGPIPASMKLGAIAGGNTRCRRPWIGICGSGRPQFPAISPPLTCRAGGGGGCLSATARLEIGAVTWLIRCFWALDLGAPLDDRGPV